MSWQDSVETHGLWAAVEQLRELCQSNGWLDDPDVRDAVSRTAWLCTNIEGRKDANSITAASLDAALAGVQALQSHLTNLRTDLPTSTPNDVGSAIDQVLTAIAAWPHPNAARIAQATRDGMELHQKMANEALEGLRAEVTSIHTQIATQQEQWQKDAAVQIQTATDTNTNLQAEVVAATGELTTQKQRLDTALNEFTAASQAAEKARDKDAQAVIATFKQTSEAQLGEQHDTTAERLTVMDGLLDQARETLQTIGKEASASHYGTYADEQRKAAFRWSLGVLSSLAAAAGFLIWAAIEHADTWHSTTARYALGVVFIGAATYAGRQSALHRALERQARQRELAIGALGSFLADVPPESVQTLKLGVAAVLFIDEGAPDPAQASFQAPASQVVDAVRNAIGKGAPKAPSA